MTVLPNRIRLSLSIFFVYLLAFQFDSVAQTYNFTLSQSQQTYSPLSSANLVANGQDWTLRNCRVPIGFSFSYQGHTYDSLTLKPNGLVSFNGGTNACIEVINGLTTKVDSLGGFSKARYNTTGNSGQRIFQLEFASCGFNAMPGEYQNVQLWLYEQNGKIEFHFGPTSYAGQADSVNMKYMGPIEFQGRIPSKGYLITGKTTQAIGYHIKDVSDLSFLINVPSNGTVYALVPAP